jgi:8-oxo-dGTP pyrophosphatase MutT (NUDIX family)
MERRYEVHIEGRPLLIAETAPTEADLDAGMAVVAVHGPRDLDRVLETLQDPHHGRGICIHPVLTGSLWDLFRERYTFVHAAGGAVQDEQGRLLVIKRLGKWDLPKGKLDKGEQVEAAALREVEEECGIDGLRILRPLEVTWHTYERKGRQHLKRTDWYLMSGSSEKKLTPQTEEDIEEVRWMTRDEVARMKEQTYPSLVKVLEAWEGGNAG